MAQYLPHGLKGGCFGALAFFDLHNIPGPGGADWKRGELAGRQGEGDRADFRGQAVAPDERDLPPDGGGWVLAGSPSEGGEVGTAL